MVEKNVDYKNEIVISNSNERDKNEENFALDMEKAISEIARVLKNGSYLVFTFHSLNGREWEIIANALLKNDFEFVDCQSLFQKTFTPRQLNRKITVKGDLLVVYKKNRKHKEINLDLENINKKIQSEFRKKCNYDKLYDTNDLILLCVRCLLKYNYISKDINFIEIIKKCFEIDDENKSMWRLKNEL